MESLFKLIEIFQLNGLYSPFYVWFVILKKWILTRRLNILFDWLKTENGLSMKMKLTAGDSQIVLISLLFLHNAS